MKTIHSYFYLAFILVAFASCKKEGVNVPDFNVQTDSASFSVNGSAKFSFTGKADYLVFYSGELGHEYKHRERTKLNDVQLLASFASRLGTSAAQLNQISIVASTDFTGIYDTANVAKATWVDITSRFTLPTISSATVATPSTEQNISDVLSGVKPVYFAFKYICRNQITYGTQNNWYFTLFQLRSQSSQGLFTLSNQPDATFLLVHFGPSETDRSSITSTRILLRGNAVNKTGYTEDWAISRSFDPFTIAPDKGIPIKSYDANRMENFSYPYTKPGVYTATFVARNANDKDSEEVVKEVTVTVTP